MKRLLIFGALLLFVTVGLQSCYKDVILPKVATTKPPQFVSFSNDLQPVFTTNCALSGCHVKGGQTPYLTPDVSYQQLLGGYVSEYVINPQPTTHPLERVIDFVNRWEASGPKLLHHAAEGLLWLHFH